MSRIYVVVSKIYLDVEAGEEALEGLPVVAAADGAVVGEPLSPVARGRHARPKGAKRTGQSQSQTFEPQTAAAASAGGTGGLTTRGWAAAGRVSR